jgi:hypothetical protein
MIPQIITLWQAMAAKERTERDRSLCVPCVLLRRIPAATARNGFRQKAALFKFQVLAAKFKTARSRAGKTYTSMP